VFSKSKSCQVMPQTRSFGVQCEILKDSNPGLNRRALQDISNIGNDFEDELDEPDQVDDRVADPDFDPAECSDVEYDDEEEEVLPTGKYDLRAEVDAEEEKYFLVGESALFHLMSVCRVPLCTQTCTITVQRTVGTMLVTTSQCEKGHVSHWNSQARHKTMPWGNLLTAGAILFSGINSSKALHMFEVLKVEMFSSRTYQLIQASYLVPTSIMVWDEHQADLLTAAKDKPLVLGGDGRCDSPGLSAKYGTYSLMDLKSGKVLEIQLVQVCCYLIVNVI
jgi:hypothetical protein